MPTTPDSSVTHSKIKQQEINENKLNMLQKPPFPPQEVSSFTWEKKETLQGRGLVSENADWWKSVIALWTSVHAGTTAAPPPHSFEVPWKHKPDRWPLILIQIRVLVETPPWLCFYSTFAPTLLYRSCSHFGWEASCPSARGGLLLGRPDFNFCDPLVELLMPDMTSLLACLAQDRILHRSV